ncbi:hypothetical protein AGR4A_pAt10369 [Agrobacterium tumefaciens str. B6]|uniref:Uncharacterized protein n=1 Tax=Agrobacterium tumefaciens str. B6 TaxID=1183423 RepID=A0A822VCT7_AGRTU|nr:hypothetical protein AGR4A_pAt10369 [Agrobacterium tumefaciens str. B6]
MHRAFLRRYSRGDFAEIYPAAQIKVEPAVRVDVGIDQRCETAIIFRCHTAVPGWFGKHGLQHARVHKRTSSSTWQRKPTRRL